MLYISSMPILKKYFMHYISIYNLIKFEKTVWNYLYYFKKIKKLIKYKKIISKKKNSIQKKMKNEKTALDFKQINNNLYY